MQVIEGAKSRAVSLQFSCLAEASCETLRKNYTILYYTSLYYTTLYYTILYYTIV